MKYHYTAYHEDDPKPLDECKLDTNKKINNLITVNIKIEIEKEKYEAKKKKYKEPISNKILKLFE